MLPETIVIANSGPRGVESGTMLLSSRPKDGRTEPGALPSADAFAPWIRCQSSSGRCSSTSVGDAAPDIGGDDFMTIELGERNCLLATKLAGEISEELSLPLALPVVVAVTGLAAPPYVERGPFSKHGNGLRLPAVRGRLSRPRNPRRFRFRFEPSWISSSCISALDSS